MTKLFAYLRTQILNYSPRTDSSCRVGSKANSHAVWGLNLSFVCNAQKCNLQQHTCVIKMELDAAERRRRLTWVQMQQHHPTEDEAAMTTG